MTLGTPEGGPGEQLVARARALAAGELTPPEARPASTVVLLRSPYEVYLLRRVKGMAFAGGMHVFPGGSVDGEDARADLGWAGPAPRWWGEVFGGAGLPAQEAEELGRALVCAAVRETFEESGVLLAGPDAQTLLDDVSSDAWEEERRALEAREQSLSDLLTRRRLVLRADLLRPMAHWITPAVETKRFDTRFFLARLPEGQRCREVGGEADERVWVPPVEALEGGFHLMPPTRAVLADLAGHASVEAALGSPRTIAPVMPRVEVDDDGRIRFVVGDERVA